MNCYMTQIGFYHHDLGRAQDNTAVGRDPSLPGYNRITTAQA